MLMFRQPQLGQLVYLFLQYTSSSDALFLSGFGSLQTSATSIETSLQLGDLLQRGVSRGAKYAAQFAELSSFFLDQGLVNRSPYI